MKNRLKFVRKNKISNFIPYLVKLFELFFRRHKIVVRNLNLLISTLKILLITFYNRIYEIVNRVNYLEGERGGELNYIFLERV
jgi:hypothetical protein